MSNSADEKVTHQIELTNLKSGEEAPDEKIEYKLNHGYLLGLTITLALPASIGIGVVLAEMS